MLQLISAMTHSRPVHACEAALTHLKIPPVFSSCTVRAVSSQPPYLRTANVSRGRSISMSPVDEYCMRHTSLEALTFTEYHKEYTMSRKDLPHSTYELVAHETSFCEFKQYKFRKPPLTRFTQFHPRRSHEAFFYNVLLERVAFRDEGLARPDAEPGAHLLSADNRSRTYFEECVIRGIIVDEESLEQLALDACAKRLYSSAETYTATNRLKELHDMLMLPVLGAQLADDSPDLPDWDVTYGDLVALRKEFEELATKEPSADQACVIESIMDAKGGLHVLCGGPGTGKTFVTKRLAHQHRMAEPPLPLVLSASTGAAAVRLSRFANTNHSTFQLPTRGYPRYVPIADPLRAAVHAKATFILDEFSMLTRDQLHMVLMRLQTLGGYRSVNAMLKEIKVVLVGDDKQVRGLQHV